LLAAFQLQSFSFFLKISVCLLLTFCFFFKIPVFKLIFSAVCLFLLFVAVTNQLQSFSFCFPLFVCSLLVQISFRGFVFFLSVGELLTAASFVVVAFHHTAAAP
jgi:hypothetical protein